MQRDASHMSHEPPYECGGFWGQHQRRKVKCMQVWGKCGVSVCARDGTVAALGGAVVDTAREAVQGWDGGEEGEGESEAV